MERPFHLRVFGPPALLDPDGRVLKFRTKKQLALLVYLSVHRDGGGVSRDQLVDLLWHDVEPKRGRHSLSQGLSVIRGVLGPDAIVTIGNRLSLSASLQTDVELLGRNGGVDADLDHPLQDLEDCSGVDFAHWVDAARQSILTATRATLLRVLQQARTRGETRTVHQLALRLHSVDPLSEVAVQTLAERLLLDGDAGGASRMLRGFLARASRLGSGANHTNLRRLIERIESDALPVNDILPERLKQKSSDTAELFVGRTREFGELEAVWEQAKAGSLRMCLMSGVAGIGKTSLIRQFSTSIASRGNLAVTIRCEEIGKAVPFAALADLIEELSKNPPLSGTDPHWLAEASRIAPALRVRYPGLPTPDQAPGESVRLRVAEALYRMLETVAEGLPLLIAIDDFQHLDQASRDVLHIVTRRLSDHASMVLGATRVEGFHSTSLSERPSSDLGTWHSKLELSPLSFEEGSMLVAELTQDLESEPHCGRIRRRIAKLAEGNPYFLEMLVSDWKAHRGESLAAAQGEGDLANTKWRPPDTLRLTFSRHYEGLLPMGRQIFELLAVAGRAMNASELGDLLGIASKKASQVVLEIIERGVLRLEGDAVSFKNELHRAFVYYAMADEARRYHHATLARELVRDGESNPSSYLEASKHFVQAGMADEAMDAAVKGAEDAVSRGAPQEAERALRDAMRATDSPSNQALLLMAEALNQQGRHPEAMKCSNRISSDDTCAVLASKAALQAEAMVRGHLGDHNERSKYVQRGIAAVRKAGNVNQTPNVIQTAAELAGDSGDLESLAHVEDEARRIAEDQSHADVAACGDLTTGFCLWMKGRFAQAYDHFTSCAHVFEKMRHANVVRALNGRGMCAAALGESAIAIDSYYYALKLAERTGDFPVASNIATNVASTLMDLGEFEKAGHAIDRGLALNSRAPHNRYSSTIFNSLCALRMLQQDFPSAGRALQRAEQEARRDNLRPDIAFSLYSKADYYLMTRMPEEALRTISEAQTFLDRQKFAFGYQGNVLRLNLYRNWALGKGNRAVPLPEKDEVRLSLSAFVEVSAFREWTLERGGQTVFERPDSGDMIRAAGLDGLRVALELLGMCPESVRRVRNPN